MKNKRRILKPIAIASVLALIFMFVFSFTTFAASGEESGEDSSAPTFGFAPGGEGSESLARGDKSQSGSQFGGKSRDGGLVIKERASETGEEGQNGEGEGQFGMTPPEGFTPGENGNFGGEGMTPPEGFTPGENGNFGFRGGRGGMAPPDGEGFRPFGNAEEGNTSAESVSGSNTPLLIAVIAEGVVIMGLAVALALTLAKKRRQTVPQTAGISAAQTPEQFREN